MGERFKNGNWDIPTHPNGNVVSWEGVHTAVLMDIRDELQTLNRLLGCPNFTRIPSVLDSIATNTKRPRRKAVKR